MKASQSLLVQACSEFPHLKFEAALFVFGSDHRMDLDPSSGPEAKLPWTVLSPLEDRSDWCDQARLAGRETLSYRGTGSSNNLESPGGPSPCDEVDLSCFVGLVSAIKPPSQPRHRPRVVGEY